MQMEKANRKEDKNLENLAWKEKRGTICKTELLSSKNQFLLLFPEVQNETETCCG